MARVPWAFLLVTLACSGEGSGGSAGTGGSVAGGGSGSQSKTYTVATCSFGSGETSCNPLELPDMPKASIDVALFLVNPDNPGACAGDLELSVNGLQSGPGKVSWVAHEKDPGTCAQVGPDLGGSDVLAAELTVDVYFPAGNFTFRMRVREV